MSNSLTITGTIKHIGQVEQPTEKFRKRPFVLDVQDGNYTNQAALQFVNDKTDMLDNYAVGQEVRVHFNIRSREWNGKWFTELTAWGIAKNDAQAAAAQPATSTTETGIIDQLPF